MDILGDASTPLYTRNAYKASHYSDGFTVGLDFLNNVDFVIMPSGSVRDCPAVMTLRLPNSGFELKRSGLLLQQPRPMAFRTPTK
jgi:hypothetical protein